MKTISIINLKGGVAKTLTADSMAHVLATLHNKRVLLVDNDKQGNTSKAFGVHSYDNKSISDVLTARRLDPREVIKKTRFENIDVMPANMTLIRANMEVLMDSTRPQQTRLRSALNAIAEENFYDFCIIDNAPDINISTINALVASDDVIIPIKIDKYAFDGLEELKEQIEDTRDDLNPRLRLAGCLITCFIRADAEKQGEAWLRSRPEYPVFDTRIRYSDKVTESTFSEIPIVEYSRRSGTAMDYTHTFKKPFEYAGETYTTLTFDFEKMTGRDMVSIETEMQMNNEYCLAPEVSRSFQAKMAAKAAGIGSDVLDAMPIKDFNRITNAARSFLIDTGY